MEMSNSLYRVHREIYASTPIFPLAFCEHIYYDNDNDKKDPYVYASLYMLYLCQDILPLAQKPVALQRRLGLLGQCLRDVALRHQRT